MTPGRDLRDLRDLQYVVKTYRYLRLAMVLLAFVLAVSVVVESVRTRRVLPSVSDYYYTPAKAVLVGALVAIGVGLIALRGKTDLEDVVLNLAGMFAPAVAFVPIPRGAPSEATVAGIDNNMTALLAGGALAVVVAAVLAATELDSRGDRTTMAPAQVWGLLVAGGVVLATAAWIALWHDGFVAYAHFAAAIALFVCIAAAVLVNARVAPRFRRVYGTIFGSMLASQLVWLTYPFWTYTVLVVEALLIVLFAVFWSLQTWELRYQEHPPDTPSTMRGTRLS